MFLFLIKMRSTTGRAGIGRKIESSAQDIFHLDHGLDVPIGSRQ